MSGTTPGVIVCDMATAQREHHALLAPYLEKALPLESASGTFVHVAAGVQAAGPISKFFRQDALSMPADATTLIVAEAGASVELIEGCAAPIYTPHQSRSSLVHVAVGAGASVRHITMQNWATNVENTITKRATVAAAGHIEWVDAVVGSRSTTLQHSSELNGPKASTCSRLLLSAVEGQHHVADLRVGRGAEDTVATGIIKMLGSGDGRIEARLGSDGAPTPTWAAGGALRISGDPDLRWQPDGGTVDVDRFDRVDVDDEHVAYLMGRGFGRREAVALIVGRFVDEVTDRLPLAFALDWEQLIERQLDDSIR